MDIDVFLAGLNAELRSEMARMVQRGMQSRVKVGLPIGRLPLGYRYQSGAAVLTEPAASVIRNVFRWIGDEGLPIADAKLRAEQSGLRHQSGRPLTAAAFLRLVRNPFYAGYVGLCGELHAGVHERLVKPDTFERSSRRDPASPGKAGQRK